MTWHHDRPTHVLRRAQGMTALFWRLFAVAALTAAVLLGALAITHDGGVAAVSVRSCPAASPPDPFARPC